MSKASYNPNPEYNDAPPSYSEALNSHNTGTSSSSHRHDTYAPPSHAPPNTGPRPAARPPRTSSQSGSSGGNINDLYTANLNLPWRYPKGHFCKKCSNTGYKKSHSQCRDCWERFGPRNKPPQIIRPMPAPVITPPIITAPIITGPTYYHPPPVMYNPPYIPNFTTHAIPAAVIQSGSAQLGGRLCWRCKGTGVNHFFLDTYNCEVCHGLGRTF